MIGSFCVLLFLLKLRRHSVPTGKRHTHHHSSSFALWASADKSWQLLACFALTSVHHCFDGAGLGLFWGELFFGIGGGGAVGFFDLTGSEGTEGVGGLHSGVLFKFVRFQCSDFSPLLLTSFVLASVHHGLNATCLLFGCGVGFSFLLLGRRDASLEL